MSGADGITAGQIQDLIDDRLDPARREALLRRVRASPARRAEVAALLRQQEALRQAGQQVLYEPVPPRLRRILQPEAGAGLRAQATYRVRRIGLTVPTALFLADCLVW